MAMSIGLHRDPGSTAPGDSQRQIWRRTWWSLYNHAQLMASNMFHMMAIEGSQDANGSSGMAMITIEDFQFGVFPMEHRLCAGNCGVLDSIESQMAQATIFIEKTRLSRIFQFSRASINVHRSSLVEPRQPKLFSKEVVSESAKLEQDLTQWFLRLPDAARYRCPLATDESEQSIFLQRAWLRLLYLCSIYAVSSGDLLVSNRFLDLKTAAEPEPAGQYLATIAELLDEVDAFGLSKYLPSHCVALLSLVLTFSHRLTPSATTPTQVVRTRMIQICWRVMRK